MVSVVKTPNATGVPEDIAACATPFETSFETWSKWGVAPRITAPSAITASTLSLLARRAQANGISHAPGTRTIGDLRRIRAVATERIDCAFHEALDDEAVEASGDDGKARPFGDDQRAFQ